MKELPRVYANKINKTIKNNKSVDYSGLNNEQQEIVKNNKINEKNINQKIREIFNSSKYVYKADVEIVLKDKKIKTKIIGQNQNHLITMENELIPVSDIIDIYFTK